MNPKTKTASVAESAEGDATLSGQRQTSRRQITDLVESYLETVENLWDGTPAEKVQEYQRVRLLLKYNIALTSPVPFALSLMERDDGSFGAAEAPSTIKMPPSLKGKISQAAQLLGCTENQAVLTVLSQNIGKYIEDREEKGDVFDL